MPSSSAVSIRRSNSGRNTSRREKLSPCVVAMVALDGPLRFTNIWAYPTLEARSKVRADAVAQGIWPPKGGPAWLTTAMTSTIALSTSISPLK